MDSKAGQCFNITVQNKRGSKCIKEKINSKKKKNETTYLYNIINIMKKLEINQLKHSTQGRLGMRQR